MYESHKKFPLTHARFLRRMALHIAVVAGLLVFSLMIGIIGYVFFEDLSCLDGFLNSAMLLGGTGPINLPKTVGGKLFAGLYALYAGLVFIIAAGIMFAPILHRVLHKFHWDMQN